jgi:hypothetical protein
LSRRQPSAGAVYGLQSSFCGDGSSISPFADDRERRQRERDRAFMAPRQHPFETQLHRQHVACERRLVSRAMNAVTTALACGEITPGEAATIAGVYEAFVRTAGIAKEKVAQGNLLRILTAGDDVEDEDEDIGDAEAIDGSARQP